MGISIFGVYWYHYRFGGVFKSQKLAYKSRDFYSKEQWQEWQQNALKQILTHCAENIPYYRNTWTEFQKQAAKKGDLLALPLLEKDPLRKQARDFCRDDIHKLVKTYHTSGSTGTPIASFYSAEEYQKSIALREVRSMGWAGVSYSLPRATFSGRIVEPDPDSDGPYYRFNAYEKQVYFSAFHLSPNTAPYYISALKRHNIQWMTGYAVSFYLLAKFILHLDIKAPPLKAVITTSEKLTPEMRTVMEQAYQCKVFEEYSTVENALFASECENGKLHVSPDVAIVEILRTDGNACDPGEIGEIVVTRLCHDYQVFVRFRLGDMGAWAKETCSCGKNMPVIQEVVGRIEDIVVGPDGRQMVRFHGVFVDQPNIVEAQVIQESVNHIHVKLVPMPDYNTKDEADVIARIKQRLGDEMRVTVETIAKIPREKSGKFKAVVSKLNPKNH